MAALSDMFLKNLFKLGKTVGGPEDVVGEICTVVEKVDNDAGCGEVKVGNGVWAARGASDGNVFEIGERLRVVAVEGVKLICKK